MTPLFRPVLIGLLLSAAGYSQQEPASRVEQAVALARELGAVKAVDLLARAAERPAKDENTRAAALRASAYGFELAQLVGRLYELDEQALGDEAAALALDELGRLSRARPDALLSVHEGFVLERAGDEAGAERAYVRALALDPDSEPAKQASDRVRSRAAERERRSDGGSPGGARSGQSLE